MERLHGSAPRERWSIVHHSNVVRAITMCASMHQTEQLELVGGYWFAVGRACNEADDETIDADCWVNVAAILAYRFCVNAEAWQLFCEQRLRAVDVYRGKPNYRMPGGSQHLRFTDAS